MSRLPKKACLFLFSFLLFSSLAQVDAQENNFFFLHIDSPISGRTYDGNTVIVRASVSMPYYPSWSKDDLVFQSPVCYLDGQLVWSNEHVSG